VFCIEGVCFSCIDLSADNISFRLENERLRIFVFRIPTPLEPPAAMFPSLKSETVIAQINARTPKSPPVSVNGQL
jgi:hypothetical protein